MTNLENERWNDCNILLFRYEQRNIFVIKVTLCTYFLCLWVWEHSIGLVRRVAPFARSQPTSSLMWRWWWGWCCAWSACWRSTWPSSTCSTPGSPRGGRPHTSSMQRRRWGNYSYQALLYFWWKKGHLDFACSISYHNNWYREHSEFQNITLFYKHRNTKAHLFQSFMV